MMRKKNIYRPFMKARDNVLKIDHRLEQYEYDMNTNEMNIYVFDKRMTCFVQSTSNHVQKLHLEQLFPTDLVEFFRTLLENSWKHSQMIHVVLNNKHILYSSLELKGENNEPIGIMLHEIPFSQVQSFASNSSLTGLQVSYVIDKDGVIFAMEKISWDVALRDIISSVANQNEINMLWSKYNSDAVLHQNIYEYIECAEVRTIIDCLINYVMNVECMPLRFCWYFDSDVTERKMLMSLSRFIDQSSYLLVSSTIIREFRSDYPHEYLSFPNESEKPSEEYEYETESVRTETESEVLNVCSFCKRLQVHVFGTEIEKYKNDFTYYNLYVAPLYDSEKNIPAFGKLGKQGYQSFKALANPVNGAFEIWSSPKLWKSTFKQLYSSKKLYIRYTMCTLCKDEWCYFFYTNHIPIPTMLSSPRQTQAV
jgi:hypothetical protein